MILALLVRVAGQPVLGNGCGGKRKKSQYCNGKGKSAATVLHSTVSIVFHRSSCAYHTRFSSHRTNGRSAGAIRKSSGIDTCAQILLVYDERDAEIDPNRFGCRLRTGRPTAAPAGHSYSGAGSLQGGGLRAAIRGNRLVPVRNDCSTFPAALCWYRGLEEAGVQNVRTDAQGKHSRRGQPIFPAPSRGAPTGGKRRGRVDNCGSARSVRLRRGSQSEDFRCPSGVPKRFHHPSIATR